MRAVTLIPVFSILFQAGAFAQSVTPAAEPPRDEQQTLIGDRSSRPTTISGWFVAPSFGTTGFGGQLAYAPGIRGGIYLNQRLAIGVAATVIGSDDSTFADHDVRNVGSYGGLLLQYVVHSNRVVHASFESTIGSGQWCTRISDVDGQDGCTGKKFLAFEPAANVELERGAPPPHRDRRRVSLRGRRQRRGAVEPRHEQPGRADQSGVRELLADATWPPRIRPIILREPAGPARCPCNLGGEA